MTNLERTKNLSQCRICQFESYEKTTKSHMSLPIWNYIYEIPKDGAASYGDLKNTTSPDENCYLMCGLMEGSDYSNGRILQKSNQKAFLEEFESCPGVHTVYGGHNTFGIAVQIKHLTDKMFEMFTSLENYQVLDESLLFEMEIEEQNEAWKDWACSLFQTEIENRLKIDINETGKLLAKLFNSLAETANEDWIEDGCSQYINVEPIAEKCTEELLTEYGVTFTKEK